MNVETFNRAISHRTCHDFIHPWHPDCIPALGIMCFDAVKGSSKFVIALHTLQLLSKGKNLSRQHVKEVIVPAIKMAAMGPGISFLFNGTSCLLRNLLGTFNYYISMSSPGFISGASIFLVEKAKRHYVISAFSGSALETFLNYYTPLKKGRKCYPKTQTLLFMIINGAFLYLVKQWKTNKADKVLPQIWFYSPSSAPRKSVVGEIRKQTCSHLHSCLRSILRETSNYFWFGTILEVLRITVTNFRAILEHPRQIVKFIFKPSTLRLAAFAATYVFLYKVTNCLLCRVLGKDDAINALVSGFVSGLSYYVHPNLSLALTAFTNLIHISWKYFNMNSVFGTLPVSEFTFMLVCGFLFHFRMCAPESNSRFFVDIISIATGGRADIMHEAFQSAIRQ